MEWTPFAGLTALDENDPITIDGASFLIRNPRITDHLLQVGAVTHRHNAHAAAAVPHVAMTGSVLSTGGALPAASEFALTYTVTDIYGGETTAASPLVLSTGGGVATPSGAFTATADYTGGILPAGGYFYALTYTDGAGGETPIGPSVFVYVEPGHASGQVNLAGLAAGLAGAGATDWRLWRSYEGADWHLVTQAATSTFRDAGFDPPDNPARPPQQNNTGTTYSLHVTLPTAGAEPALASGTAINIYLANDTSFVDPCLYAVLPLASAGASLTIAGQTVTEGAPPHVSLALPGAAKIDPATDLVNLAITGTPASGDVLTATSPTAATWAPSAGGGGGGSGSVAVQLLKFAITYDMAGLNTGVVIYTPTIGDVLLNAWIEVDTAWDGTTPLADIGTFPDSSPSGTVGWFNYIGGVIDMTREDHDISGSTDYDGLLVGLTVRSLLTASALAAVTGALKVSGTSIVYNYATSLGSSIVYPRLWVDLPAKFTTAAPIKVVVSQSGTAGSVGPGATQGAATVYLQIATPA